MGTITKAMKHLGFVQAYDLDGQRLSAGEPIKVNNVCGHSITGTFSPSLYGPICRIKGVGDLILSPEADVERAPESTEPTSPSDGSSSPAAMLVGKAASCTPQSPGPAHSARPGAFHS